MPLQNNSTILFNRKVENPRKLTPSRHFKLTPVGHFKLTP